MQCTKAPKRLQDGARETATVIASACAFYHMTTTHGAYLLSNHAHKCEIFPILFEFSSRFFLAGLREYVELDKT